MDLPSTLAHIVDRLRSGASADTAHLALRDAGATRVGCVWLLGPWSVTTAYEIDDFEANLRRVGKLGLGIAPAHVLTLRSSDGVAFVFARYDLPEDTTLMTVPDWPGPFRNAMKDAVIKDLKRLARARLRHAYAYQSFQHWRAAAPGGQLVLLDWGALGSPDKERLAEDVADAVELVHELPFHLGSVDGARTLATTYQSWLQGERAATDAMVSALMGAGRGLESMLWTPAQAGKAIVKVPDGRWAKTRAHLGAQPPPHARPGELWFDTIEACAAVFVGSGWLSLAPLRGWQLAAWPELPVDRDAVVGLAAHADHREPVHCLTATEADALAARLGKVLAPALAWDDAARILSHRHSLTNDLWEFAEKNWLAPEPSDAPEPSGSRACRLHYGLRRLDPDARSARAAARTWVPAGAMVARGRLGSLSR